MVLSETVMGYRVHKDNDNFKVVEVVDGEIKTIMTDLKEEKAKDLSRGLNFGNGFDGWTPDFFLNRLEVSV